MPAFSTSAPGKVILFGEHAVVYGQPAIAVPVKEISAKVIASPLINASRGVIRIEAPQVSIDSDMAELSDTDPLAAAVRATLKALEIEQPPAFKLHISSSIPLAAGLGSGAAVSVAIARAVSAFIGKPLPDERVSAIAFEVEKLHHGTPSGIDNTVITYKKPVYFVRGEPIQTFQVAVPFSLLIADTGIPSPTRLAVGDVRMALESEPERFDKIFRQIGEIAKKAKNAIEAGENQKLGSLMNENHGYLKEMNVSSAELDKLVKAAQAAGALGAKLSGGGRGGNMIALVNTNDFEAVEIALQAAGAKGMIRTTVQ